MDIKLTDFCIPELNALITALASYQVDLMNKIEIAETYEIPHEAHKEELERVILLVTQTLNAKAKVIEREIIYSN